MKQKTEDHLISAIVGIFVGAAASVIAAGFIAIAAAVVTGPGLIHGIITGGLFGFAACGGFIFTEYKKFRPATAIVSGLAAGIGLFFAQKPSTAPTSTPTKAPVENTKCKSVSFLNHENAFNTLAQNSKKTLVLTAKDFSSAPVIAQRMLAA